jgi:hypothetical protein
VNKQLCEWTAGQRIDKNRERADKKKQECLKIHDYVYYLTKEGGTIPLFPK